ncbi:MAG TPA: hypothetical protein VL137_07265 [Polyangiaceae bacterium]|nr:hypothetical protein [Polyangiaceae bacterium]
MKARALFGFALLASLGACACSSGDKKNAAPRFTPGGTVAAGATRDLHTDTTGLHLTTFTAKALDGAASQGHATDNEIATVDTSLTLKKQLCVVLPERNVKPGFPLADWVASKGYHVFQVAYQNDVQISPPGDTDPNTPADTRMDQFDGKGRVNWVAIARADSIEARTEKALAYLASKDPGGDWGWFLNDDGSVRWADTCFVGYGYGGSHAAIIARHVTLARAVSLSAPDAEGRPDATWLTAPSTTPLDRLYAVYGGNDNAQALGSYNDTTASLGYIGDVFHTTLDAAAGPNPFDGSHRILLEEQDHAPFCVTGVDHPPCLYVFGLPQP